jgi:hypothetical protein
VQILHTPHCCILQSRNWNIYIWYFHYSNNIPSIYNYYSIYRWIGSMNSCFLRYLSSPSDNSSTHYQNLCILRLLCLWRTAAIDRRILSYLNINQSYSCKSPVLRNNPEICEVLPHR